MLYKANNIMKITKSRLKEIIKEELDLVEATKEQVLEEGLLDDAIARLKAAISRIPEEDRGELQDVLASISQLGARAPEALEAAAEVELVRPDPGLPTRKDDLQLPKLEEKINEDN